MNPGLVAQLLNVPGRTLHRWTEFYADFLLSDATPPKGQPRVFSEHDVRVMKYVSDQRSAGQPHNSIKRALHSASNNHWEALPALPADWQCDDHNLTVPASLVERLKEQQIIQEALIEEQRQLLQMAGAALKLSHEQRAASEQRARFHFSRHRLVLALLTVWIIVYWVVVLSILLT
ncbi:MerR family transcriptional regulator [Aggregatilinea lenta]|uniref:MerR family transcriptional regulator n=1 Tax=Aggregatilinea lenta TaxID=913108 RepID=UPI0013C30061|nr:MerR family transcriptional regulator [Aggregatilinea lenta]